MIEEDLLNDDRIMEVHDFQFEFKEDACKCVFYVSSIYGEIEIEKETQV